MSNLPPPPPPPPPGRGQQSGPQPPTGGKGGPLKGGWPRWTVPVLLVVLVGTLLLNQAWPSDEGEKLSYTQFVTAVEKNEVVKFTLTNGSNNISGELKDGSKFTTTVRDGFPSESELALLTEQRVDWTTKEPDSNWLLSWIGLLLPFVLIIGFLVWMNKRAQGQMGNVMSIGRSRAKAYQADKPSTTFADIAGYEGVKQEITEVVDFLRMPERFREIGARVPKGMLLVGPPGTGKTLFARAVAGEAGVGFLSVTGSDFMEMFVGVGASRVRDLFAQARKLGRAIIFIDEIDSIGRKRGAGLGGGHDEREQTLNQMLSEMDGFETSEGIVILAATNRPDILDPALLRPGRFDRQIVVPLPENNERLAILKVHSRDKRMGPDVDLEIMSKATPGMSGADLANLVNESALFAVRRGSKQIERIDFENARDRVVMGARRESLVLSAEEKRATAIHEGGHAILTVVLANTDPLHKVTILPRGMALGVTWSLPEERHTYSKILQWLDLREIRVRVGRPGFRRQELRLWTSLLSHRTAPALELAQLYATRWEHELYFREAKRVLRQTDVLQSHTVVTAAQEIAAIVVATALLARERARAADGQVPVLRLKFGVVLAVVRSMWFFLGPCEDLLTARQKQQIVQRGEALMRRCVTAPRRSRTNPRAVRQPVRKWPRLMETHSVEGPLQFTIV